MRELIRPVTEMYRHHNGVSVLTGTDEFVGPGHNTAIQDDDGDWWMVYHVEATDDVDTRVLTIDPIQWTDGGWPIVGDDGTPSAEGPVPQAGADVCGTDGGSNGGDDGDGGDSNDTGDDTLADGMYRITNVNSGKFLEVGYADTSNGATVNQWADTGHSCQKWVVEGQGEDGEEEYTLENANSGQLLEVEDASTSDGDDVQQWPSNGHATQRWRVLETDGGTYRLENANSGLVAGVENASTDDGANVEQQEWNGGDAQRWTFTAE